jgi:2-polyprenyl-3-methyl-5-hydroxy-6-metoxy-1,4-benzoquinol methylase
MEQTNPYDDYAVDHAKGIASLEEAGVEGEPLGLLPRMLDLLGNLDGLTILDAGCGEGYLSRVLASRSAKVTGIDVSPRLIQIAREKDPDGAIEYRVGDLSKPLPVAWCSTTSMTIRASSPRSLWCSSPVGG